MTIINLRDFYYWYTQDEYMEVSDDVAEALRASVRYEAAYQRRVVERGLENMKKFLKNSR